MAQLCSDKKLDNNTEILSLSLSLSQVEIVREGRNVISLADESQIVFFVLLSVPSWGEFHRQKNHCMSV